MGEFSKTQTSYRILTLLIVVGSCIRVLVCFQHNPLDYLWSDPLRHWLNAGRFPKGGYMAAADPILYQVYLFGLRKLTGDNRILIALASAALSVLMPWTYYRAARDFGLRKIPALWVWALIVWTPSLIAIYHYIMMETLLLALEGTALWMTARYLRKGGRAAFLICVFCWTLTCLTKPTVIPLAGICLLWALWKRTPSVKDLGPAVALSAVLLLPQAIRSEVELGFLAPFGNPWLTKIQHRSGARTTYLNFYPGTSALFPSHTNSDEQQWIFNSPSCGIRPLWPLSSWAIRRARGNSRVTVTVHADRGAKDWRDAYAGLNVGWNEWFAQWGENVVLFFFSPSWPEIERANQWDGKLEYLARWMWAPLIVFVLAYNGREFLHRRFELIPVAVTVFTLFLAFQNVATAEGRYRKPLEPLLLLNAIWVVARERDTHNRLERNLESVSRPPDRGPAESLKPSAQLSRRYGQVDILFGARMNGFSGHPVKPKYSV